MTFLSCFSVFSTHVPWSHFSPSLRNERKPLFLVGISLSHLHPSPCLSLPETRSSSSSCHGHPQSPRPPLHPAPWIHCASVASASLPFTGGRCLTWVFSIFPEKAWLSVCSWETLRKMCQDMAAQENAEETEERGRCPCDIFLPAFIMSLCNWATLSSSPFSTRASLGPSIWCPTSLPPRLPPATKRFSSRATDRYIPQPLLPISLPAWHCVSSFDLPFEVWVKPSWWPTFFHLTPPHDSQGGACGWVTQEAWRTYTRLGSTPDTLIW